MHIKLLCCRIILRDGFQVPSCCYLKKLGIFGSKHGTRVYALAYNEGRFEKVQTSKDGLYDFLLVVYLGFRLDQ